MSASAAPPSARLHDPIAHSRALEGFVAGALVGLAAAAGVAIVVGMAATALAASVATAGLATPLVAGVAVTVGEFAVNAVVGGALVGLAESTGEKIGAGMMRAPSGAIAQGSSDVRVNRLPAARVTDAETCHAGKVAQGSASVFFNRQPAARVGDKVTCGATIVEGSGNVFIGGGTVSPLTIQSEVPEWVRWAAVVVGILPALGGAARAIGPALAEVQAAGFARAAQTGVKALGRAMEARAGGTIGRMPGQIQKPRMSMSEAVGPEQAQIWTAGGRKKAKLNGITDDHLSDDEMAAIYGYTTDKGYEMMNPALRGQAPHTPEIETFAQHLDNGLNKLPAYEGTSYRGHRDLPPSHIVDEMQPGKTTADPAPRSSADDPLKAFPGPLRETIHGQTGRDISGLSHYGGEGEILFKRGTRFEVLDRSILPDGSTHVTMREIRQ